MNMTTPSRPCCVGRNGPLRSPVSLSTAIRIFGTWHIRAADNRLEGTSILIGTLSICASPKNGSVQEGGIGIKPRWQYKTRGDQDAKMKKICIFLG